MCACMSQRPGMRNVPCSSTARAPVGGGLFAATLMINAPRMVTVLFGAIRPSTTSTTLTWVIASIRVCDVTGSVATTVATTASRPIMVFRSTMRHPDLESRPGVRTKHFSVDPLVRSGGEEPTDWTWPTFRLRYPAAASPQVLGDLGEPSVLCPFEGGPLVVNVPNIEAGSDRHDSCLRSVAHVLRGRIAAFDLSAHCARGTRGPRAESVGLVSQSL